MGSPELIPGSPLCFEKSTNVSMALFSNTEKVGKICVKTMVSSCENDAFTCFGILCLASNILVYDSAILMGIAVLVYILILI